MQQLLQKPVVEFMTKKVITVRADQSIKHVFELMEKHAILGLPVVNEKDQVVGMVTESDLVRHFTTLKTPQGIHILGSLLYLDDLQEFNKSLKEHCAETVSELMTKPVVTAPETASLAEVLDLMATRKVNRLPVTDKAGKLAGLVTRTDILHQISELQP